MGDLAVKGTERPNTDEQEVIEPGQWYWVKEGTRLWLGCVTWVGSNYAEIQVADGGSSIRVAFAEWGDVVNRRELVAGEYIDFNISRCRGEVKELMGCVKRLTANLGLVPLADRSEGVSTALAIAHDSVDVDQYKKSLILAKEETLPDLFEKIKSKNAEMARWMHARMIPLEASARVLERSTEGIGQRIFVVELYAGLCEELQLVRDGDPADVSDKIALYQRRHYMDEECLVAYEAGGMEFRDISEFDSWLSREDNFERVLPSPRSVVAFRVRRNKKDRDVGSLAEFIQFQALDQSNKQTFLYLRNGEQLYRLMTELDFGEQLFPDQEHEDLFTGDVYIGGFGNKEIISEREYKAIVAEEEEKFRKTIEWDKLTDEEKQQSRHMWPGHLWRRSAEFEKLTPESLYYDDGRRQLLELMAEHNRVAVVVQGLLDRSPAFNPHPPWQLWTAVGFNAGIELVYDDSRALVPGDAPDFEAYRARLNKSIRKGTMVVGQQDSWEVLEAEKENARQETDWRIRSPMYYKRFSPYGNSGPGDIAEVASVSRDGRKCTFRWLRDRQKMRWIDDPDKPGYMKLDKSGVPAKFVCRTDRLLNLDAYTPGDYKQFYEDPRTRAEYREWASLMLRAEDYHANRYKA